MGRRRRPYSRPLGCSPSLQQMTEQLDSLAIGRRICGGPRSTMVHELLVPVQGCHADPSPLPVIRPRFTRSEEVDNTGTTPPDDMAPGFGL